MQAAGRRPASVALVSAQLDNDEEEELSAYDLLVSSLQPLKRARVEESGKESGESVRREEEKEEEAELTVVDSGEEESDSDGEAAASAGRDPFSVHVECDLTEEEVRDLKVTLSQPLHYQHTTHPVLGSVSRAVCLSARDSSIASDIKSLAEHHVKQRLTSLWTTTQPLHTTGSLTPLQRHLFALLNSYKDVLFTRCTFENAEEIRRIYVLHALNHILKTRSRVLKNNARLARAAREGRELEEAQDQGLTRPKVLILVPFREAALRTINIMISLLLPPGEGQVSHRKRFQEEFSVPSSEPPKVPKPASFQAMFAGNIDDCFRLGVAVQRNMIKLYSEFYSSDLIIASPLGLRTIIGTEGEKRRDFDFLSSLEVVIVDQTDVFLMQNWSHLTHVFEHLHCQPRESHGVDFSRVRSWVLNGWSQFYRQTLLFGSFPTAETNALFSKYCYNFAGRVRVSEPSYSGSVCQVVKQVPQIFHHINCSSHTDLPEARFSYFTEQVLPECCGELMKQTLVFVPSYFDFVRLRNYMRKEGTSFTQICEYTRSSDISRARTKFFHRQRQLLLYTERMHFYRRFHLRGIGHVVFYSLPLYPEFYSELVNCLEVGGGGVTVLYSRYDALQLTRVVGSVRAGRMLASQDSTHVMVTTGH